MTLKTALLSVPVLGHAARAARRAILRRQFSGSGHYWETRYQEGGTSGAGSYGRLAAHKAEVLNAFVTEHAITSVVELGCGDGAQLQLATYPNYTGVDVARASIKQCQQLFKKDATKEFVHSDDLDSVQPHDLSVSLDVIYHLVEDEVFEKYMQDLFRLARRYVIIYASNVDQATESAHVRHRRFTDWVTDNEEGWLLTEHLPNKYPTTGESETDDTSFADFYIFSRLSPDAD